MCLLLRQWFPFMYLTCEGRRGLFEGSLRAVEYCCTRPQIVVLDACIDWKLMCSACGLGEHEATESKVEPSTLLPTNCIHAKVIQ